MCFGLPNSLLSSVRATCDLCKLICIRFKLVVAADLVVALGASTAPALGVVVAVNGAAVDVAAVLGTGVAPDLGVAAVDVAAVLGTGAAPDLGVAAFDVATLVANCHLCLSLSFTPVDSPSRVM